MCTMTCIHLCKELSRRFLFIQRISYSSVHPKASISTGASAVDGPLHYLDGRRIQPLNTDTKDDITVIEPATGEVLCTMRGSCEADVHNAVVSAKSAFPDWSVRSGRERGAILLKAASIIRENLDDIAAVETRDNGKPLWESKLDTEGCADSVEFIAGLAPTIAGRHISLPQHSVGLTRREPLGVVGAIGAFNYPFQMASWKSAPALACGNTVVFKPSPLTPLTGVLLAEVFKEAGLPDGCFNVIQGEANPGSWLSHHPDIAKMTFTGSVATGSKVMEACAKGIKKVTLELGGKSPVIVFEDADLENAVKATMVANFLTQGQVCSNGTRVFVHRSVLQPFLERLVQKTRQIKVGDPGDADTQSGAMISEAQAKKVLNYVETAKQQGATVLCGGERITPAPHLANGWYISPCVLGDVTDDMTVAREEIFGPVVCVMAFDSEDEVLQRANDTEFGLASGVFTKDVQRAHRVAGQLQAGNVYINNYNIYPPELPFGGHKKSGVGLECGTECIEQFTQVKTVYLEGGDVWSPFE